MKSVICSSSSAPPGRRLRERRAGVAVRLARPCSRAPVEPELAHVGQLAVALVAAPRLAQGVIGARHVEDVVDDLEQHAQLGRERAELSAVVAASSEPLREQQYALHGGADQPAGLELVQAAQARAALRRRALRRRCTARRPCR